MTKIKVFDVTEIVAEAIEKSNLNDSNSETDIKKAGIWNLMDAFSKIDNSRFSAEQAKQELIRREVVV